MANTLSSSLVLDSISRVVITPLGSILAPLGAFTTDFSDETYTKGQNVRFRYATTGPSTQTNPTNWESGDSVQDNINLQVNHYSVSWHIDPDAIEKGYMLDQFAAKAYQNFGAKVWDVVTTPLTSSGTTNFANHVVTTTGIARANLQTVWAAIADAPVKNLILGATAYAQLLPADANGFKLGQGAYGFDNWYLATRAFAGTNVHGFAGHPGALGIIAGLPKMDDEVKADLQTTTLTVPLAGGGTGQGGLAPTMTVLASTWVARATRIRWASLDVMLGAAKLDNTACRVLVSTANP
jgi:hypothetical protein